MYYIELDKLYDTEILDKFYKFANESGILTKSYIAYSVDKFTENINKYDTHFTKIYTEDVANLSEDDRLDIFMDMAFHNKSILLDVEDTEIWVVNKIISEMKAVLVDYKVVGVASITDVNFGDASENLKGVVSDLMNYEMHSNIQTIGFKDMLIRFRIDSKGDMYNTLGKKILNIKKAKYSQLYKAFLNLNKDHLEYIIDKIEEINKIEGEYGISMGLYETWYFLGNIENMIEDILEYKFRVYDYIKEIDESEFYNLDKDIQQILMHSRYMPLSEIKRIENRNDDLFITDWFIENLRRKIGVR